MRKRNQRGWFVAIGRIIDNCALITAADVAIYGHILLGYLIWPMSLPLREGSSHILLMIWAMSLLRRERSRGSRQKHTKA
mmetsp:Transcript_32383/g.64121  ORF Transcript_32383/g.64121 Transcript_32383/m.64121 type:complete len:80 (+) Transcript_32383:2623-2862(+)